VAVTRLALVELAVEWAVELAVGLAAELAPKPSSLPF